MSISQTILTSIYDLRPNTLPANVVEPIVNNTTVKELAGIRIAAIRGESVPCTAKYKPIKL